MRSLLILVIMAVTLFLNGCGNSQQEMAVNDATKDNDTAPLSSCSYEVAGKVSIATFSMADTAAICEKMARRVGVNPSSKALRSLSKAVYNMLRMSNGKMTGEAETAYQFMRVVESRGQLNDEQAMLNTFNVVFKIYIGMEGRVTPKELNIILSSMGNRPKQMSDDDIYRLAAMYSIKKQDEGY